MSIGTKNNNPFDLRYDPKIPWMGLAQPPQDEHGYCMFVEYANKMNRAFWGLRAGFRDLYTKWGVDKLRTIEDLVAKFAPANENNVEAYIKVVCEETGWAKDEPLDLSTPANLKRLGKGFLRDEQGQIAYNDSQLDAAITSAMHRPLQ